MLSHQPPYSPTLPAGRNISATPSKRIRPYILLHNFIKSQNLQGCQHHNKLTQCRLSRWWDIRVETFAGIPFRREGTVLLKSQSLTFCIIFTECDNNGKKIALDFFVCFLQNIIQNQIKCLMNNSDITFSQQIWRMKSAKYQLWWSQWNYGQLQIMAQI